MEGISFASYGLRIGIRVNRALPPAISRCIPIRSRELKADSSVDHLYSVLISDSKPADRVRKFNLIYRDALLVGRHADYNAALELLSSDLQGLVAEYSVREIFVHAGAVGWKGRAILIPGSSQSGKSTLTAALVHAGATYYSDEYAVLNSSGQLLPFPVDLSIRENGTVRKLNARNLGGTSGRSALPIGAVILTEFRAGHIWKPKMLSPAQGMLGLLAHTVQAQTRAPEVLQRLKHSASRSIFLRGPRGEASEAAEQILQRVKARG